MIPLILGAVLAVRLGPVDPGAPARSPYLAANSTTVAITFGAGKTIYFSASYDRGKTFSTPVKVADASVLPLSRHRGPHVAFSGNVIVVTAVAGERLEEGPHAHGLPSDGNLLAWRSLDGGATWSKRKPVNDAPGSASEGLHALAAGADGMLVAVWLDKRGGNPPHPQARDPQRHDLHPDRGVVFDVLLGLVRRGLGGAQGSGRQYVSWSHETDFVRAIDFLIAREDLAGVVNLASPHPLPNRDFMRALRQAWGTRIGLPATSWMLEIGTWLMRTESELVLKSRRAVPGRLLEAGFRFDFP